MKIALITTLDPSELRPPAGLLPYMLSAFEENGAQVDLIGHFTLRRSLASRCKRTIYRRFLRRVYSAERDTALLSDQGERIGRYLQNTEYDVVLSILAVGSQPVAYVDCPQPIFIWSDCTFASAIKRHPSLRNVCAETERDGRRNEREAIRRATTIVYTSDWAAESAARQYSDGAGKLAVVPMGGNIDTQITRLELTGIIASRGSDVCRLVLVGTDWLIKGCDTAVEAAAILNQNGVATELDIIGCESPRETPEYEWLRAHGFVSKRSDSKQDSMEALLAEAHFMILPSRCDCTPHVIGEACAFGVPCITSDVGGIPTLIRDGRNGMTLPQGSSPSDYAKVIKDLFLDRERYVKLAVSAFDEYENRLNWRAACRDMLDIMQSESDIKISERRMATAGL